MTKNIKKIAITSALALSVVLASIGVAQASTFVLLTAQLDYGQTSANVTNLQTFLASAPSIYPQGRVTGYFGPLTKSAVMNFQNAFGISQVGRVGPQTLEKINSLIMSGVNLTGVGGVNPGNSTIAPTIYSIAVSPASTSVVVSWSTTELTLAQVYYSTTPFQIAEAVNNFAEPVIQGGTATPRTASHQMSQVVSIQNLQPHTLYYYMLEATDTDGNLSYTMPATFVTGN
jgi:peptidoglycan hydrolase-like protein with peptidoglycan-binding domain